MGFPALTVPWSAVLVMVMLEIVRAHVCTPVTLESPMPSSTADEMLTVPQVAAVVGEVMWMWKAAPEASSSGLKLRFPSVIFFFNDTATTEIYTLSLHDALPISETVTLRAVPAPALLTVIT